MSRRGPSDGDDRVWKALSDPTRRHLLDLLGEGPRTTGDLCGQIPALSRTAVLKHLSILEEAGLVLLRREGRLRWNYLNPVPIQAICERWVGRAAARASSALRLKGRVETAGPRQRPDPGAPPRDNDDHDDDNNNDKDKGDTP